MLPCWRPGLSLQISYVSLRHLGIKIPVHSKASEVKSKAESWRKNNASQGELLKHVCRGRCTPPEVLRAHGPDSNGQKLGLLSWLREMRRVGAQPSRARSALRANVHYRLSLCSSSHCYTEGAGREGLRGCFEIDEADLGYKRPLCPPSPCLLKANELERKRTQGCTQTMARVFVPERVSDQTHLYWLDDFYRYMKTKGWGGGERGEGGLSHLHVLYVCWRVDMKGESGWGLGWSLDEWWELRLSAGIQGCVHHPGGADGL